MLDLCLEPFLIMYHFFLKMYREPFWITCHLFGLCSEDHFDNVPYVWFVSREPFVIMYHVFGLFQENHFNNVTCMCAQKKTFIMFYLFVFRVTAYVQVVQVS